MSQNFHSGKSDSSDNSSRCIVFPKKNRYEGSIYHEYIADVKVRFADGDTTTIFML